MNDVLTIPHSDLRFEMYYAGVPGGLVFFVMASRSTCKGGSRWQHKERTFVPNPHHRRVGDLYPFDSLYDQPAAVARLHPDVTGDQWERRTCSTPGQDEHPHRVPDVWGGEW